MGVMSRKAAQAVNFFPLLTKASVGFLLINKSCFLTPVAGLTRNFCLLEQPTSVNLRNQDKVRTRRWMLKTRTYTTY